jgi:hypothetical protein
MSQYPFDASSFKYTSDDINFVLKRLLTEYVARVLKQKTKEVKNVRGLATVMFLYLYFESSVNKKYFTILP